MVLLVEKDSCVFFVDLRGLSREFVRGVLQLVEANNSDVWASLQRSEVHWCPPLQLFKLLFKGLMAL
jgi:hypothetical protein